MTDKDTIYFRGMDSLNTRTTGRALKRNIVRALSLRALVVLAMLVPVMAWGQGIRGMITDESGLSVPFATVYVQALHRGTTANELGQYQLALPPGRHEVRFQYLGYKTVTMYVDVAADGAEVKAKAEEAGDGPDKVLPDEKGWQTIQVEFEAQQYRLPEFVVTASGEDPAYYIMRRAISMSQYYLQQVSSYTSMVYLKGSGVITSMPALVRKQMEREGVEEGKYFVTENISKISFELPDRYKTEVISLRSSGNDNQSSPMSFVTVSLYRDINGIISPLSRDAFRVYRFVLEGSFMENGEQINKIRVEPRRPGSDLYAGTIFIREGGWNLHSVDLRVSQTMLDISFRQVYHAVAEGVWMPISHNFDMQLSLLGFDVSFAYLASVSDYEVVLNPALDHGFYLGGAGYLSTSGMLAPAGDGALPVRTGSPSLSIRPPLQGDAALADSLDTKQQQIVALMERDNMSNRDMRRLNRLIRKDSRAGRQRESLELMPANTEIADSARMRDRAYWDANRPVVLTPEEQESFNESVADTTSKEENRRKALQTAGKLIVGSRYKLSDRWSLNHGGIIGMSTYAFNTVDGLLLSQKLGLSRSGQDGRRLSLSTEAAWSFARSRLLFDTELSWRYHPLRRASFTLQAGRLSSDFQSSGGMPPMFNTYTSLYFRQNLMKVYDNEFLSLSHNIDIANGLVLTTGASYARRRQLNNNSTFSFARLGNSNYTPNLPPREGLPEISLSNHTALIADAVLSYTPRYFYRMAGKQKIMMYSRFPTLSLSYRQGIAGLWDGDAHFRQMEASVRQVFSLRLIGQFSYRFTAGKFLDTSQLYFADYRHFATTPLWIKSDTRFDMFRNLPYYEHSTTASYGTAHFQYDHARILLKRLPWLAEKLIREKIFFNGLILPGKPAYTEFGYGLDQLWLVFGIELVTGWSGGKHQYTGIRIGIPLTDTIMLSL